MENQTSVCSGLSCLLTFCLLQIYVCAVKKCVARKGNGYTTRGSKTPFIVWEAVISALRAVFLPTPGHSRPGCVV